MSNYLAGTKAAQDYEDFVAMGKQRQRPRLEATHFIEVTKSGCTPIFVIDALEACLSISRIWNLNTVAIFKIKYK